MSLDIELVITANDFPFKETVFETNITRNLIPMAEHSELYIPLWKPHLLLHRKKQQQNELYAKDIISHLEKGLTQLKERPFYFKKYNASNGWGKYKQFVPTMEAYLAACKKHPNALIEVQG